LIISGVFIIILLGDGLVLVGSARLGQVFQLFLALYLAHALRRRPAEVAAHRHCNGADLGIDEANHAHEARGGIGFAFALEEVAFEHGYAFSVAYGADVSAAGERREIYARNFHAHKKAVIFYFNK